MNSGESYRFYSGLTAGQFFCKTFNGDPDYIDKETTDANLYPSDKEGNQI